MSPWGADKTSSPLTWNCCMGLRSPEAPGANWPYSSRELELCRFLLLLDLFCKMGLGWINYKGLGTVYTSGSQGRERDGWGGC